MAMKPKSKAGCAETKAVSAFTDFAEDVVYNSPKLAEKAIRNRDKKIEELAEQRKSLLESVGQLMKQRTELEQELKKPCACCKELCESNGILVSERDKLKRSRDKLALWCATFNVPINAFRTITKNGVINSEVWKITNVEATAYWKEWSEQE